MRGPQVTAAGARQEPGRRSTFNSETSAPIIPETVMEVQGEDGDDEYRRGRREARDERAETNFGLASSVGRTNWRSFSLDGK